MTDDRQVRDVLADYVSAEPPMTIDPETVLRAGRHARNSRQLVSVAAGALGVCAALAAGYALGGNSSTPAVPQPAVAGSPPATAHTTAVPSYPGPVPALIEARVRAGLPGGPSLVRKQIYPSDWNRKTPLPVSQTANATDWHAQFAIPARPGNQLWAGVFITPPGSNPSEQDLRRQCAGAGTDGVPSCSYDVRPDGSLLLTQITRISNTWTRTVLHFRADDRVVNVREKAQASTYQDALRAWRYPPSALAQVATDGQLVIPQPVVRPPLPDSGR
jgi:hypothetical protein